MTLDELYAKLPTLECKGDCADICQTVLTMSRLERKRIEDEHGPMTCDERGWCKMLENRRCKAHAVRPMICRLWGVTEDMACPFGCKPYPRYLTPREGAMFLLWADRIGGKGDHEKELAEANRTLLTIKLRPVRESPEAA